MTDQTPSLPPVKIAFVIDGTIVDVLHTDERLGAIFLSDPTIVDVTSWLEEHPKVQLVNGTYDGTTFTPPSEIPAPEEVEEIEETEEATVTGQE